MDTPGADDEVLEPSASTDAVLSESVERVRSSRELIDQIDQRLARGQQILEDEGGR